MVILGWLYMLIHGVDVPWWYSKLTGSYPPPNHDMRGFYKFTLSHLVNISCLILLWWHPIYKRLFMAFNYCFVCLTLMSVSSNIGWFRNPNHMGHVPDFVHELIGVSLETIAIPGTSSFTKDHQPYQLNAIHTAEYIMLGLMYATIAWALTQPWRWLALRRWFTIQGTLALLRSITVLVTNVPDSRPYCHTETPGTTPYHELPWPSVWERTFQLATMGDMVTCGDMVYSGHTMLLVLCGMAWHSYYKVVNGIFTVNIVKFFIWILILFALFLIIATRLHYTLDVLLALYLTITIWGAYHRAADDVFVGHQFIAVYIIDGLLLYPAISWLEAPELGEAADSGMVSKYPRSYNRLGKGKEIQWAAQVAAQYFSDLLSRTELQNNLPRVNLTTKYDKLTGIQETNAESNHNNTDNTLPELQLPNSAINNNNNSNREKLFRARSESEAIAASEFLNDLLTALSANADILENAASITAKNRAAASKLNSESPAINTSINSSPKGKSSIRSPLITERNHHRTPSPLISAQKHPNSVNFGRSPSRPSDADIATAASIMRRLSAGLSTELYPHIHNNKENMVDTDNNLPDNNNNHEILHDGYSESRSGLVVRDFSEVAKSVAEWVRNVTGNTPKKDNNNNNSSVKNNLSSPSSTVSSSSISTTISPNPVSSPSSQKGKLKQK